MKNKIAKITFIILSIVLFFSACMTVFAVTTKSVTANKNGLEATLNFNKQEYNANENVEVTLNVKNNNSYAVKNIQTELIVPSTLKLSTGNLKVEAFSLNAGESKVQEVALEKVVETNNNEPTTNSPQTGDNVVVYIAMMVVSASALVVIAVKKKWIHKKGVMSLVLCFTLVGAMTLTSVVNAESTTKEFTVEGTIKVDGEDVVIKGKVTYTHEIYSKLQIDGADKGMYVEGDTVTITAEDAPEGKHFAGWTVVKGNVTLADKNSKSTTFVMGNEEVEIKANYEVNTYTIEVTSGENGKVSPAGSVSVNYGENQEFKITANTGYHIENVEVDGANKGKIDTYTFNDVKENHTIDVTFAIDTFTITTKTNNGGVITGNTTVNYNGNTILKFVADSGYDVVDVKVNGNSKGKISSYTFENVIDNNQKIEVVFGVTTEESFINAIRNGGTVELANNITLDLSLRLSGVTATINGNGYNITEKNAFSDIILFGSSDLTINNANCYIKIYNPEGESSCLNLISGYFKFVSCDGGLTNVYDGTIESFYASVGLLKVYGGVFYRDDVISYVDSNLSDFSQSVDADGKNIWVVTEK